MASVGARAVPATARGSAPGHDHSVELFLTDDFLTRMVTSHVAPALSGGSSAVLITRPEISGAVVRSLAQGGEDVATLQAQGRLRAFDRRDLLAAFHRGGEVDADAFGVEVGQLVDDASDAGAGRPAFYGDMVGELWDSGQPEAALALEDCWNRLADDRDFSLFCAYRAETVECPDRPSFDPILHAHPSDAPATIDAHAMIHTLQGLATGESSSSMLEVDRNGIVQHWHGHEPLLGHRPADLLSRPLADTMLGASSQRERWRRFVGHVARSGRSRAAEFMARDATGATVAVEAAAVAFPVYPVARCLVSFRVADR